LALKKGVGRIISYGFLPRDGVVGKTILWRAFVRLRRLDGLQIAGANMFVSYMLSMFA